MRKVLLFLLFCLSTFKAFPNEKWLVYYSDKADLKEFNPYSLIVLDSDYHPELEGLIENEKLILGYISLGEIEEFRSYFKEVKAEGLLLGQNEHWSESYFIDLRNPLWAKRVIEKLIPNILQKGFKGIFIDTLDNSLYLEQLDPQKYGGMNEAATRLIQAIRLHYPNMPIMLNRAYHLLPSVQNEITMALGEGVYSRYDFDKKDYIVVPAEEYQQTVSLLQKAKDHVKVFTLDYWNPKDKERIKKIYQLERENGFIPYVSTINLDEIVKE